MGEFQEKREFIELEWFRKVTDQGDTQATFKEPAERCLPVFAKRELTEFRTAAQY